MVSAEINTNELRVMTFNVHYANRRADAIAGLIQAERPDIIAVQELTRPLADLLLPQLRSEYPYYLEEDTWGLGTALISRYPLLPQPKSPRGQRLQLAQIKTPEGSITIWNIHPPTAVNQEGWEAQRQILTAVAEAIEAENGPLIVLGDFNTTAEAENYGLLASRLTDVHYAVGQGFGFTYPEPDVLTLLPWYAEPFSLIKPVVRIDHILVSQHFVPQDTYVFPDGFGSDHRPVVATLRFADR